MNSLHARAHLHQLALLRWIAIGVQVAIACFAYAVLEIRFRPAPLAGVILLYALLNGLTVVRLHALGTRFWPRLAHVAQLELFVQLLIDVAAITALLYFTGGTMNPFASCYLLPLLYASIALPARQMWSLAVVCIFAYAALHFFYVPLPLAGNMELERILSHVARFAVYLLLGALLAWFGARLGEMLKLHARDLQEQEERRARERYLLGVAALAAGTAHEIGTPLSTMQIVVGELRRNGRTPPQDWKDSIDMLWGQIQVCKHSLNAMARAADVEQLGKVERVCARQFIRDVASRFRELRPGVPLKLRRMHLDPALTIEIDHGLPQAVINFLTSAADASPQSVELSAGLSDGQRLAIRILDRGPGIPGVLRERMGKGFVTTKDPGRARDPGVLIGLAAVERFGGTVHISDRPSGGTLVEVRLPLFPAGMENDHDYRELRIA